MLVLVQSDSYCDINVLPSLARIDSELITSLLKTFVRPIRNLLPTDFVFEADCPCTAFSKTIVRFTSGTDCVMQIQIYWDHLNCTLSIKRVAGLLQEGLLIYKQSWVEGGRSAITI